MARKTTPPPLERGALAFPYVDLDGAIEVAKAIWDKGGRPLERDQLAAAMNLTANSGNFSIKIGAARQFGLIETAASKNQLTALGFDILDAARAPVAKARAFLEVPLYRKVYEEYRGRQLPPRPHGLENAFVTFGVAPKQKDKARHVFDRSARIAGFFPNPNEDRLVAPPVADGDTETSSSARDSTQAVAPASTPKSLNPAIADGLHPFIRGLLETLPAPHDDFPAERRAKWLEAAANIFELLYKGDGWTVRVVVDEKK